MPNSIRSNRKLLTTVWKSHTGTFMVLPWWYPLIPLSPVPVSRDTVTSLCSSVLNLASRHFISILHLGSFDWSLNVLSQRASSSHDITESKVVQVWGFCRILLSSRSADSCSCKEGSLSRALSREFQDLEGNHCCWQGWVRGLVGVGSNEDCQLWWQTIILLCPLPLSLPHSQGPLVAA